jgi:hypothetical protein
MPSYAVHYHLTPYKTGTLLRIWEASPFSNSKSETNPIYNLNYAVSCPKIGWKLLNEHLRMLGARGISYDEFDPKGGQITITSS